MKQESVQPVRSFKVRGALNKVIGLSAQERAAGVITASAGNHGQGVAYAARVFGIPATVHVPEAANPLKVEAMERLGARVLHGGSNYAEAFELALKTRARTGASLVHAYDDLQVIAGQGTLAVELLGQLDRFDTILVPVGGGGLISGIASYLKARRPEVRIVGVEPAGADAMTRSLRAGARMALDRVDTIADGLAASAPGRLTFEIAHAFVDDMIVVSDEEMIDAVRLYFEWEHLLAEPAGAAAMAALLNHLEVAPTDRVVVVLSGANIGGEVMARALRMRRAGLGGDRPRPGPRQPAPKPSRRQPGLPD